MLGGTDKPMIDKQGTVCTAVYRTTGTVYFKENTHCRALLFAFAYFLLCFLAIFLACSLRFVFLLPASGSAEPCFAFTFFPNTCFGSIPQPSHSRSFCTLFFCILRVVYAVFARTRLRDGENMVDPFRQNKGVFRYAAIQRCEKFIIHLNF